MALARRLGTIHCLARRSVDFPSGTYAYPQLTMPSKNSDNREKIHITSARELHEWLRDHHERTDSVWLVTFKKDSGARYVSMQEILDELVSFGWTDGIRQRVDDERTMQLISPRRTKPWAKSYKDRAEKLIRQGRMQPPGQRSVDEAKASGAWEEMADVDALVIPDDLRSALEQMPPALANFEGFPPSTRRNILRWIEQARTTPTRSRRIERIRDDAAHNVRTPVNG